MNLIDFLPDTYRLALARRTRIMRELALLGAVALAIAIWYASARRDTARLEVLARTMWDQAAADQTQATEAIRLETRKQDILKQTRVERGLTEPVNLSQVLATMAKLMSPSLAATSLTVVDAQPAPAPPGAGAGAGAGAEPRDFPPQAPLHIELKGVAPTDMEIADFVGRLTACPLFANVKMDYSRAMQAGQLQGREFRLQIDVPLDCDYQASHGGGEVANAD